MSLDWAMVRTVSGMIDPVGVLSIYVTLDPHEPGETSANPPWELRLRQQLAQLRDERKEHAPREHWKALTKRLDQLQLELEPLLDPATSGLGRALFAPVTGGPAHAVSLQVPLGDRVVLAPRAHLRPLVAAWSAAGPAGAVSVSAQEIRLVDVRFGLTEPVDTIRYPHKEQRRELKGPGPSNPAMAQHSSSQHDLFAQREDDHLARFLRTLGPQLAAVCGERGWDYLALTGEAPLVQAVREGLPPAFTTEVVTLDAVSPLPAPKLGATVAPALADARRRRHRALAEQARSNALSANAGAYGLGETLGALQQGRVAHLLLAANGQWAGHRTPDGFLVPDGEVPPGVEPAALVAEPRLGERMIELALDHAARVTLLEPAAAEPLADADQVGALLRW